MGKDMQNRACEVAMDAFNSYKIEKDIATKIKRTFDEEVGACGERTALLPAAQPPRSSHPLLLALNAQFGPQYDGGEKYKGGGTWHCIVGRDFGCAIAHETKHLIFFKVEQVRGTPGLRYASMQPHSTRAHSPTPARASLLARSTCCSSCPWSNGGGGAG